ncbi:exodeoxyribonuclease V subunit gamma [Mannheimia massilioguelmaensis]|uniref:exodeoxyribonuclease V subunit gamma n=1 Tax=Mannheimia massilioguelmaensis TaxID=1604354 RepID=UPI0005C7F96E|nr:exodeoxyribonuclease V subunit gamma [Mannheimia massilioguelmaensis]
MFTVYHSNKLDVQKDILIELMELMPLDDPFQSDVILVQSPGMSQWLQLKIAEKKGISANIKYPMPATFIWQQYSNCLEDVSQQTEFTKDAMTWRLMQIIPDHLDEPSFQALKNYLSYAPHSEQHKLYQLARTIADLFDQYLVYRPNWIQAWEQQNFSQIEADIKQYRQDMGKESLQQIIQDIQWQGILWNHLVALVQTGDNNKIRHRANLHREFIEKLKQQKPENLPKRIFIFGISALPKSYLETFEAMSQYCDIHLFFNNPSQEYWGDIIDQKFLQKLQLRKRITYQNQQSENIISLQALENLDQNGYELSQEQENLQVGNPLLASWGKLGRDFFYLLTDLISRNEEHNHEISAFVKLDDHSLLSQVQRQILELVPSGTQKFKKAKDDRSISLHSCHSVMREVEVLHDYLLDLFEKHKDLTPKDIVVMVADIDTYTPYIQAVFGQYQRNLQHPQFYKVDERYIPFSISDNKLSSSDVIIATFLMLLNLKESQFSAEEVLAYLDIPAIRENFNIAIEDLETLRDWVANSGIRFGLEKENHHSKNYNAWQAGIERMLLGYAMRAENGIWQDSLGFDQSHGLRGQLAGSLSAFIETLYQWQCFVQSTHSVNEWHAALVQLLEDFFAQNEETQAVLFYLNEEIQNIIEQLHEVGFEQKLEVDVIAEHIAARLDDTPNSVKFLVGRVSFCTLLPMRAIPFKVVCLLGMNDGSYPRQQTPNSFDLMQHHHQKGDRFRRDDDRYLFLEALLAAEDYLYISYVGQSIIDNHQAQPSVLVSQLLDYLAENLAESHDDIEEQRQALIQQHAMRIFSPNNFNHKHHSYAKEWLSLVNYQQDNVRDFVQPIDISEQATEVDIIQLVQFVQNPVKFFFEKRLGVYFENVDEQIPDTENFSLTHLDNYLIKDELLNFDENEVDNYFETLKVQGILPYGHFGEIYQQKLMVESRNIRELVSTYSQQEPQYQAVEVPLEINGKKILLTGNLTHLYDMGSGLQRIRWRVGSVKDKQIIENWLYYLLQLVTTNNVHPPVYVGKDNNITFKNAEEIFKNSTALSHLSQYVADYLQGLHNIQIVPTQEIKKYLKYCQLEDEFDEVKAFNILRDSMTTQYGTDVYWSRVFSQSTAQTFTPQKLLSIQQMTQNWFTLMLESILEEKH